MIAARLLRSPTRCWAVSWLSQKPGAAISSSMASI
jgi:hypothetical protein